MNNHITALRQQLQQLQAQRDAGTLDAPASSAAKAALERRCWTACWPSPRQRHHSDWS